MSKLLPTVALVVFGVAVLAMVEPALARLVHALVPLVLVAGIVAAVLRLVWWHTRH